MTILSDDPRITAISGRGITLRGDDIDTDQILPSRFLKTVTFQGIEAHVFADNRSASRRMNRLHAFDDPRFSGASLLYSMLLLAANSFNPFIYFRF